MNTSNSLPVVVIGAGMADLLMARVLREFFSEVINLEKDVLEEHPNPSKGVPQSYHPHVLLVKGLQCLEKLFPRIEEDMVATGALQKGSDASHISTPEGVILPVDIGHTSVSVTRPLIEWTVRQRVQMISGIRIVPGKEVLGVRHDAKTVRITGLVIRDVLKPGECTEMATALVVDASGRTSKAMAWLQEAGYKRPREDVVNAGIGYASFFFHVPHRGAHPWKNLLIQPHPLHNPRSGLLQEVENGIYRWF